MPSVAIKAHWLLDANWLVLGFLCGELTVVAALSAALSLDAALEGAMETAGAVSGKLNTEC